MTAREPSRFEDALRPRKTLNPATTELREPTCETCALAWLCLPRGLSLTDVVQLDALRETVLPVTPGVHLFRSGDPLHYLYAVRSGYFKTYTNDARGREHVNDFHLPGDLLGLEAVYRDFHQINATALGMATVCRFPYPVLLELAARLPKLQVQLMKLVARDLRRSQIMAGNFTAVERLAAFLADMSRRMGLRGYDPFRFRLTMSRLDIANHLRLTIETVSRTLTGFQNQGLITVSGRNLCIIDPARLNEVRRNVPNA